MAVPVGADPFETKIQKPAPRKLPRYETSCFDLTSDEELGYFAQKLTQVGNAGMKYSVLEFKQGSTVEGTPYIFFRTKEDVELKSPEKNGFKVFARRFIAMQFPELDEILNSQHEGRLAVLHEIQFTYKTGDIGCVLIWAEIDQEARSPGGGLSDLQRKLKSSR